MLPLLALALSAPSRGTVELASGASVANVEFDPTAFSLGTVYYSAAAQDNLVAATAVSGSSPFPPLVLFVWAGAAWRGRRRRGWAGWGCVVPPPPHTGVAPLPPHCPRPSPLSSLGGCSTTTAVPMSLLLALLRSLSTLLPARASQASTAFAKGHAYTYYGPDEDSLIANAQANVSAPIKS